MPLIRGRALIGGASNSAVNQLMDELVGAPGRLGIAYAPLRCEDPRCGCRLLQPRAQLDLQKGRATGSGQAQIFSLIQRLRRDVVQLSHMQGSISTAFVSSIALNLVQMVHLNSTANS